MSEDKEARLGRKSLDSNH